ncbi:hypothetical protein LCGC14_0609870 [marine sediment metagenome]|uniref:Portal protein n=1 Tax=marine sediment metagenome TaxID=412755 RepID=A0A0F9TUA5_9ZZZZ
MAKTRPTISLPKTGPGSASWWSEQLEASLKAREALKNQRRDLIARYRGVVNAASEDAVRVNIEFEKTESKRHQLLFQLPQLFLKAHPVTSRIAQQSVQEFQQQQQRAEQGNIESQGEPPPDLERALKIFREVLQRYAGPEEMNTKALLDKNLIDVLCPAGIAAAIVGYERFKDGTRQVSESRPPSPEEQQQSLLPGEMGLREPQDIQTMVKVPNIVYWRIFSSRISPGHLYVPVDFTGSDYSRECDWLAYDFKVPVHIAKRREWQLPETIPGLRAKDDNLLVEPSGQDGLEREQLDCIEVWCFPQRIYADVSHPLQIRRMIFVKDVEQPVLVEDRRHQVFDPDGRFQTGIRSLPIKVLTLRYASDHWIPPSDCWISKEQSDELSAARTQMAVHRKKAIAMRWVNVERIMNPKIKMLVMRGEYYGIIPVQGNGNEVIGQVAQADYPRENFTFQDIGMSDINRAWALGANQEGVKEDTARTATELSLMQQATDNRLTGEKGAVTDYWLSIMEAASDYLQLYAEDEDIVEIVGVNGSKELAAWNRKDVPGRMLFDIVPNSSNRPDEAHDRDQALNIYNLMSNSPFINTKELVKKTLIAMGVENPDVLLQDPPEQPAEGPRVSMSIKSESLSPVAPEVENVELVLNAMGMEIDLKEGLSNVPDAARVDGDDPDNPVGPAQAVDPHSVSLNESDSVDRRGGGLVDAAG